MVTAPTAPNCVIHWARIHINVALQSKDKQQRAPKKNEVMPMIRKILAVVLVLVACAPLIAFAHHHHPVSIRFLEPKQSLFSFVNFRNMPTQFQTGWPMTIEMTMRDEETIATINGPPFFPNKQSTGYVIFSDPDGCLAMDSFQWPSTIGPEGCPDVRPPSDETFVEFTPDVDDVALEDNSGNESRRMMLVDAFSAGQEINSDTAVPTITIGPRTSGERGIFNDNGDLVGTEEIVDGYGFGADDDIVGLVLIAEHGAGIVYDADGNRKEPLELNNLAGFTNSVSYELNNLVDRTTVSARIVVPRLLIAPLVIADECVGDLADCDVQWRVDGGPAEEADTILGLPPGTVTTTFRNYTDLFDGTVYKISAMVVSGTAPKTVVDMNGNGRIDRADLTAMGYTVLSNKESLRLRQLRGDPCNGGVQQIVYQDFDDNGSFQIGDVCPASPGGKTKVPR